MKKFIKRILLFSLFVGLSLLAIFYMANGTTDPFYLRFTSPRQGSMILGTSRAAQGLQPAVLNAVLSELKQDVKLYNYSFTLGHSPYGPVYYESIKRKLDSDKKDGIFILAVDPWSISSNAFDPNDSTSFNEANIMLGKLKYVNIKPNLFYLINCYDESYFNIIKNRIKNNTQKLHDDGWFEVSIKMDQESTAKRQKNKIAEYRKNNLPKYKFSKVRYEYLGKTIDYLQKHGKVYLVRLPVSCEMLKIENELMPEFDEKVNYMAEMYHADYFNFKDSCASYQYTDGNHLYKSSGKKVSEEVARMILEEQKSNK